MKLEKLESILTKIAFGLLIAICLCGIVGYVIGFSIFNILLLILLIVLILVCTLGTIAGIIIALRIRKGNKK